MDENILINTQHETRLWMAMLIFSIKISSMLSEMSYNGNTYLLLLYTGFCSSPVQYLSCIPFRKTGKHLLSFLKTEGSVL